MKWGNIMRGKWGKFIYLSPLFLSLPTLWDFMRVWAGGEGKWGFFSIFPIVPPPPHPCDISWEFGIGGRDNGEFSPLSPMPNAPPLHEMGKYHEGTEGKYHLLFPIVPSPPHPYERWGWEGGETMGKNKRAFPIVLHAPPPKNSWYWMMNLG